MKSADFFAEVEHIFDDAFWFSGRLRKFQSLMNATFSDMIWPSCLAYFDDVLVFTPSFGKLKKVCCVF